MSNVRPGRMLAPVKVALVGGGFLGMALARALGSGTVVATRSGQWRDGEPPPGVVMHALDLTADTLQLGPLRDCESLHIAVAPGNRTADRRALYVEGTRRLLEQSADIGWKRIVYVSSTSALPAVDGWVFESDPRQPDAERGQVQRDAEDQVIAHGAAHGIATLVLRLGGLYGPQRALGGLYRQRADGPLPGDGNTPTNLIHLEDAVQASRAALLAPADVGGIVHVVDDDHTPRRVMYDTVAKNPGASDLQWEREIDPAQAPVGKRVSNLRMKLDLGVVLKHPVHR